MEYTFGIPRHMDGMWRRAWFWRLQCALLYERSKAERKDRSQLPHRMKWNNEYLYEFLNASIDTTIGWW
jgi:hypothetical protein